MTVVSDQAVQRIFGGARTGHALSPMPAASAVLDAILIAVAGTVGLLGRAHLTPFADAGNITDSIGVAGPIMLLGWLGAIVVVGGYRDEVYGAGRRRVQAGAARDPPRRRALGRGLATSPSTSLSRGFFLLVFVVGIPLLLAGDAASRRGVHARAARRRRRRARSDRRTPSTSTRSRG